MPRAGHKSNSYDPKAIAKTVQQGEIAQLFKLFDTASCMIQDDEVVATHAESLKAALGIDPRADLESLDLKVIVEEYKKKIETALLLENQPPLFNSGECAKRYLDQLLSLEKMRCLLSPSPTQEQVLFHATKLEDVSVDIWVRLMIALLKVDEHRTDIKEDLDNLDRLLRPHFQHGLEIEGHNNFVMYMSRYLFNFQVFMDKTRSIPALAKEQDRVNTYQIAYEELCKKLLPKSRKRRHGATQAEAPALTPPKRMRHAEADDIADKNRALTLENQQLRGQLEALKQQLEQAKQQASSFKEQFQAKDEDYQVELARAERRRLRVEKWRQSSSKRDKKIQDLQASVSREQRVAADAQALASELQRQNATLLAAQQGARSVHQVGSGVAGAYASSALLQDPYSDPRLAQLSPTFFTNPQIQPDTGSVYWNGQPVAAPYMHLRPPPPRQPLPRSHHVFFRNTTGGMYQHEERPLNSQQQQAMFQHPRRDSN